MAVVSETESMKDLVEILEGTPDFVGRADPSGRVLYINKAGRRMIGIGDDEDISNVRISDCHPEWAYAVIRDQGLPTAVREGIWSGETALRSRDGREILVSQVIIAHKSAEGGIRYYSTIIRDISNRKRAEREFKRLNEELERRVRERTAELEVANKELESFAYAVSHDLRGPLHTMGLALMLMEGHDSHLDAEGKDYLQHVRLSAARMGEIVEALLGLSRVAMGAMRREAVDLSRMAEEIAAQLRAAQPERKVDLAVSPNLVVTGDPKLLRIVLENLIGNAWKFTARREQAKIEVGMAVSQVPVQPPIPACEADSPAPPVYFVRDNGAGFDPAEA